MRQNQWDVLSNDSPSSSSSSEPTLGIDSNEDAVVSLNVGVYCNKTSFKYSGCVS